MAISSRFNFVSPGISIQEIDNSQLPAEPINSGPAIIGRLNQGPGLRPVKVNSRSEFVEIFGNPVAGGRGGDVWREGNQMGPTYAAYAAFAWLRSGVGPATVVRLLGADHTSATADGQAGWDTELDHNIATSSNGGAYGLFLIPSGGGVGVDVLDASAHSFENTDNTGSLAAIFYLNHAQGAAIVLSGNSPQSGSTQITQPITGTCALVSSVGPSMEFKMIIKDGGTAPDDAAVHTTNFNFDRNSDKYIRKVFNTNPVLNNPSVTDTTGLTPTGSAYYFLGETFVSWLDAGQDAYGNVGHTLAASGSTAGDTFAFIAPILSGTRNRADMRAGYVNGQTGWFFSQDLTTNHASYTCESMQRLFKFHGLDHGEWVQNNLKISITDIKLSTNQSDPYGTFTVELRRANDTDGSKSIVEKYTNCNLNPSSVNYVARKIGDRYMTYDDNTGLLREYGQFDNQSRYVRIEMHSDVEAGSTDATYLPFGVFGPPRFRGFVAQSGAVFPRDLNPSLDGDGSTLANNENVWVSGSANANSALQNNEGGRYLNTVPENQFLATAINAPGGPDLAGYTASFVYPGTRLRKSASQADVSDPRDTYFGLITTRTATGTTYDEDYPDYLRAMPEPDDLNIGFPSATNTWDVASGLEFQWVFSLDDITTGSSASEAFWSSGSRVRGTAMSQVHGSSSAVLELGYDSFTSPFYGGFDGLDITEKEPFGNHVITAAATEASNYAYYSVRRAIKAVADPEVVDCNMIAAPGITNQKLTEFMISTAESRGDAMAVIDIEEVYTPKTESTQSYQNRVGNVDTAAKTLKNRNINSSYACTYYPWVQVRDSLNGAVLWVPPSVVALGTFGSSQAKSELWFAPAGFTRGGLSEGNAGLAVTGVTERLTKKDRDTLYAANINPIASFPNEGIVVFGQKTLQVTPSALDRINVRRLLIFLKKRISLIASRILFDQNVRATWQRFKSQVEPFLGSVKSRLGLTEFKVVLDETTTTPDLVDRNILYAKIFLKPARSIEFIAIDFVITRTGAAFED